MTRHHVRAWWAVTVDYLPLALTVVGVLLALLMWRLWPDVLHEYPLAGAFVALACLCLGLAVSLIVTRRALRRHSLCGGPLAAQGLWICPILALGRESAGDPPFSVRGVAVNGQTLSTTSTFVPTPHARARVLVVEDDPIARHIMVHTLETAGYEVEATGDGAHALYILGHERPAVMILDLMLPTLDGPQIARAQQQLKEAYGQATRIVVATVNPEARAEAADFGADAFLVKPVDAAHLLRTVAGLIGTGAPPYTPDAGRPDDPAAPPRAKRGPDAK